MLFKDELFFLSNFHPSRIFYRGTFWPSVEHAFQATKCKKPEDEETIRKLPAPAIAKKQGRRVELKVDWEEVKDDIMTDLVFLKFKQNQELRKKLLETKDLELEEGNYWHDNYWGNCYCPKCKDVVGQNVLGQILMCVREHFKGEQK